MKRTACASCAASASLAACRATVPALLHAATVPDMRRHADAVQLRRCAIADGAAAGDSSSLMHHERRATAASATASLRSDTARRLRASCAAPHRRAHGPAGRTRRSATSCSGGVNMELSRVPAPRSASSGPIARRHRRSDGPERRLLLGRPREHAGRPGRRAVHEPAARWPTPTTRASSPRLSDATYAADFKAIYGADAFNDVETAYAHMARSHRGIRDGRQPLRRLHQQVRRRAARQGHADSAAEARGIALFTDAQQGQLRRRATRRHVGQFGALPIFTDCTYDKLGVPRNDRARRQRRPELLRPGPVQQRGDQASNPESAARSRCRRCATWRCASSFFHNGRFHTLKDALTFYVQRDANPEKCYPLKSDGTVRQVRRPAGAVPCQRDTRTRLPYNRHPGDAAGAVATPRSTT